MSRPDLRSIAGGLIEASPGPAQKRSPRAQPNAFAPEGGRGRGRLQARRAHDFGGMADLPDPFALRAAMAVRWGAWVRRHFRRPEDVAVAFGVTFQAARNWFDGLHRPSGETVLLAQMVWGGEFTAFMREGV